MGHRRWPPLPPPEPPDHDDLAWGADDVRPPNDANPSHPVRRGVSSGRFVNRPGRQRGVSLSNAPVEELLARADSWIAPYWNADHLRRTVHWVRVLDPDASPALLLASLTHDVERLFAAPDAPVFDARKGPADPDYVRRHSQRSARLVGDWLREQGADENLIAETTALIAAHEDGGWPAADLLQAADSLSFLETNVDRFIQRIPTRQNHLGPAEVRAHFRHTLDRIRLPAARDLARPLFDAANAKLDAHEAAHPEPIATTTEERA